VVGFGGVSSGRTTPSVNLMKVRFSVLARRFASEMVIVGERAQVRFDLSPKHPAPLPCFRPVVESAGVSLPIIGCTTRELFESFKWLDRSRSLTAGLLAGLQFRARRGIIMSGSA
jgi:hypothetical protein